MSVVKYKVESGIAWLTMNNPPLNALSHALRQGILAGLDRALADVKVRVIVITGNDRAFSSGADIKEFTGSAFYADPFLPALVDALEASAKPVVAAIGGACMGGGLELALGCHYRVARGDAKISFPEVKLGLIPGAQGTQRLPRLVGLEAAVNLIVSGATVPAATLAGTALFDAVTQDSLANAAAEFTGKLAQQGYPVRRVRDLTVKHPQAEAFLQFAKTSVAATNARPVRRRMTSTNNLRLRARSRAVSRARCIERPQSVATPSSQPVAIARARIANGSGFSRRAATMVMMNITDLPIASADAFREIGITYPESSFTFGKP